jgi:hypothetical protein
MKRDIRYGKMLVNETGIFLCLQIKQVDGSISLLPNLGVIPKTE